MGTAEVSRPEGGTPTLTLVLFEGGAVGVVVPGASIPVASEGEGGAAVVVGPSLAVGLTTVAGIVGSSGADVGERVKDSTDEGPGSLELDVSSMTEPVGFEGSSGLRVVTPWVGRPVDTVEISTLDVSLMAELVGFEGFPGPRRVVTTSVDVVGTATDVDEDSNSSEDVNEGKGLLDEVLSGISFVVVGPASEKEDDEPGSGASVVRVDSAAVAR